MSAVSVQVLAAGWLLTLFLCVRRRSFTLAEATGDDEMKRLALTGLVLVLAWLVAPGGFLFTGVLVLLLSLASPAGRLAWRGWWSSRTPFVVLVLAALLLGGLAPAMAPTVVEAYGDPVDAPAPTGWPRAAETVHLVATGDEGFDLAVVSVRTLVVPWQGAGYGMAGGTLALADATGQAEREMRSTVLLLDEAGGPTLDAELLTLKEVAGGSSHDFRLDGSMTQLAARRWTVYSELGGLGPQQVGEVVVVAAPAGPGVVELLTVVRPTGHPDLRTDPYAETLVESWWSARML